MLKETLAACSGLLLAACTPAVITPFEHSDGSSELVESVQHYPEPRHVPATFQHLIDWHTATEAVVLLVSADGWRACAIPIREAYNVRIGHPYRCRWRSAR